MKKIVRKPSETPSCLLLKVPDDARKRNPIILTVQEKYTKSWTKRVRRFKENKIKTISFSWEKLDKELHPLLLNMTNNHCSFCDTKFDEDQIENSVEIEHFKPKIKYPKDSYNWHNLFIICHACNKAKNDEYKDELLKPDENNYQFDDYFRFNFRTGNGEIEFIDDDYQDHTKKIKAKKMIEIYKLNRTGLCKARMSELKFVKKLKSNSQNIDIDNFKYRNYLERGLNE